VHLHRNPGSEPSWRNEQLALPVERGDVPHFTEKLYATTSKVIQKAAIVGALPLHPRSGGRGCRVRGASRLDREWRRTGPRVPRRLSRSWNAPLRKSGLRASMGSALNFSELRTSGAQSRSRRRSEKQRTDPEHGIRLTTPRQPVDNRAASGLQCPCSSASVVVNAFSSSLDSSGKWRTNATILQICSSLCVGPNAGMPVMRIPFETIQ